MSTKEKQDEDTDKENALKQDDSQEMGEQFYSFVSKCNENK